MALKPKNPQKMWLIILTFLVVAVLVVILFVKNKVYIEGENGEMYAGKSGRLGMGREPADEEA